jgi:hypothetical protein
MECIRNGLQHLENPIEIVPRLEDGASEALAYATMARRRVHALAEQRRLVSSEYEQRAALCGFEGSERTEIMHASTIFCRVKVEEKLKYAFTLLDIEESRNRQRIIDEWTSFQTLAYDLASELRAEAKALWEAAVEEKRLRSLALMELSKQHADCAVYCVNSADREAVIREMECDNRREDGDSTSSCTSDGRIVTITGQ